MRPFQGQEPHDPRADRTGRGQHDRLAPASGQCFAAVNTAAAAVVFAPFESSMTETRIGPKKAFRTSANNASPAATSEPPTKIAVERRSSTPRVNMAP